jgi:ppGpp synthetase/RelA/SpoT-type nucleotidyltranferase
MSARLTQIQDIAGYRVVIGSAPAQESLVAELVRHFQGSKVYDRRQDSSHGYRAVHLVVTVDRLAVEIQVRTVLQHLWSQLSERLADTLGHQGIKYGDYPIAYPRVGEILSAASDAIADFERREMADRSKTGDRRSILLDRLDQALVILEK